jgi:small subunit ribosomal protein S8
MLSDPLSNALSAIKNAEVRGKDSLIVRPSSKTILAIFEVLKKNKYLKDYKFVEDNRGGLIRIQLAGTINKIGAIKPRYSVNTEDYEKFEMRYLPAKDYGLLLVSTDSGIMTHIEAKDKNIGGVLLAYVF